MDISLVALTFLAMVMIVVVIFTYGHKLGYADGYEEKILKTVVLNVFPRKEKAIVVKVKHNEKDETVEMNVKSESGIIYTLNGINKVIRNDNRLMLGDMVDILIYQVETNYKTYEVAYLINEENGCLNTL